MDNVKLKIISKIDNGAFSTVYKSIILSSRNKNKYYAFKHYHDVTKFKKSFEKNPYMIKISRSIPGVCKIFGPLNNSLVLFNGQEHHYSGIIMEFIDGVNIFEYLSNNHTLDLIENFILQVIKALVAIHKYGLIHCDLKPDNIMIDVEKKLVKIIDFGLSTDLKVCKKKVGSLLYMAPEMLKGQEYSNKIDVYSFGIMLYCLVEKKSIYPDSNDPNLDKKHHAKILKKGFEDKIQDKCKSEFWGTSIFLYPLLENT